MNEQTNPVGTADDINLDLYCLECGYNLRGLSGDPRRCPECGHQNAMSDLTLPAAAITEQLRRMETAPTTCVAAAMFSLLAFAFLVLLIWVGDTPMSVCPVASLGLALGIWLLAAGRFKDACGNHPAWRSALISYHLYGLGAGIPAAIMIVMTGITFGRSRFTYAGGTILLLDGIVVLVLVLFGRWARGNIKRTVDPIQRDVAVRLARRRMAKIMRRRR